MDHDSDIARMQTTLDSANSNTIGAKRVDLPSIQHELRTQDEEITADPIFIVQQKVRIYGIDRDYTETFAWFRIGDPEDEATVEEAARLDAYYRDTHRVPGGWSRVGYHDTWEFVTACFTRKGCENYLRANGHNLNQPRIYVASGYRNEEWIGVRNFLMHSEVHDAATLLRMLRNLAARVDRDGGQRQDGEDIFTTVERIDAEIARLIMNHEDPAATRPA